MSCMRFWIMWNLKKEVLMNDLLKMLVLFIEYCYGLLSDHAQISFLQAS